MLRSPRLMTGLLSTLRGAMPADVAVHDGGGRAEDLTDAVFIGFLGDPEASGEQAVLTDLFRVGAGQSEFDENATIQCAIWVLNGDGDYAAARERVYEILGIAKAAIDLTPALGITDFSVSARVTQARLQYVPAGEDGLEALLLFDVYVTTL